MGTFSEILAAKDEEIGRLMRENLRLKWILTQALQRWAKDGFALFHMVNEKQFKLSIQEDQAKKLIDVRIKAVNAEDQIPPGTTEAEGEVRLN